jgi:flagellar biosynthesis GTPase FlhF
MVYMASGDDKKEEEEFEDIPSEVDSDASKVGNTSAQDKLKKAVKDSSKEESKKNKKEEKKKEKEKEKKKEDIKKEKEKKKEEEDKRRRKRTTSPSPSPSSSSSENGDGDDEYYGTRIPKRTLKPKAKPKKSYGSVSFNYDSLPTKSKDDVCVTVGKLPQFDGTNLAKWKHMMKSFLTGLSLELWNIVCVGFDDPEDSGNLSKCN